MMWLSLGDIYNSLVLDERTCNPLYMACRMACLHNYKNNIYRHVYWTARTSLYFKDRKFCTLEWVKYDIFSCLKK